MSRHLGLWRVTTANDEFYVVANADDPGDLARQLAKAMGLHMTDKLPRPLHAERMYGRVLGRVK